MHEIKQQLRGYRLTTAEILYHMPDHPSVLQSFVWQFMDLAPRYPKLSKFLTYWESNIDGDIHSVTVAGRNVITPGELKNFTDCGYIH